MGPSGAAGCLLSASQEQRRGTAICTVPGGASGVPPWLKKRRGHHLGARDEVQIPGYCPLVRAAIVSRGLQGPSICDRVERAANVNEGDAVLPFCVPEVAAAERAASVAAVGSRE